MWYVLARYSGRWTLDEVLDLAAGEWWPDRTVKWVERKRRTFRVGQTLYRLSLDEGCWWLEWQ